MDLKRISSVEEECISLYIVSQSKIISNLSIILFRETYGYSFVGINQSNEPIELTVDAAKLSKDMLYLPSAGKYSKII